MEDIASQLYEYFSSVPTDNRCFYIESFVVICWLHKQGEKDAALKMLPDLFRVIGNDVNKEYMPLYRKVRQMIDGNEDLLIASVPARVEVKEMVAKDSVLQL